jgi:hypothetical protein
VTALKRTGGHDPIVTLHDVEGDGAQSGVELVRVRCRMAWK